MQSCCCLKIGLKCTNMCSLTCDSVVVMDENITPYDSNDEDIDLYF